VPHVEVPDLFVKTVVEFLNSKGWLKDHPFFKMA
jgi:hypothetical protein